MMQAKESNKIRDFLKRGNTLEAIKELKATYKPNSSHYKEILRIEARYNVLQKTNLRGVISFEQYTIEHNKINDVILNLTESTTTSFERSFLFNRSTFVIFFIVLIGSVYLFYATNPNNLTKSSIKQANNDKPAKEIITKNSNSEKNPPKHNGQERIGESNLKTKDTNSSTIHKNKSYILNGVIVDENNIAIKNATIMYGEEMITSDDLGRFKLETTYNLEKKIIIQKAGYKKYSEYTFPRKNLEIKLIKK